MKKTYYFLLSTTILIFISLVNIFLIKNSNINHILGINIIFIIYTILIIICSTITNKEFKKYEYNNPKNIVKNLKIAFVNSFTRTSITSIIFSIIIYGFLKEILEILNIKSGIINFCIFASKIWFSTTPFIGLEIAIFKYFTTIEYYKKPILILISKSFIFLLLSFLLYNTRKVNCFIYSKSICDFIYLTYYTTICFDLTLNRT